MLNRDSKPGIRKWNSRQCTFARDIEIDNRTGTKTRLLTVNCVYTEPKHSLEFAEWIFYGIFFSSTSVAFFVWKWRKKSCGFVSVRCETLNPFAGQFNPLPELDVLYEKTVRGLWIDARVDYVTVRSVECLCVNDARLFRGFLFVFFGESSRSDRVECVGVGEDVEVDVDGEICDFSVGNLNFSGARSMMRKGLQRCLIIILKLEWW